MSPEQLKTIACPVCSNVNPVSFDECIKCGMDLRSIKQALTAQGLIPATDGSTPVKIEAKLVPAIPRFPKQKKEDLGELIQSELILIRGQSSNQNDLIAYFFQQIKDHDMPDVEISNGDLIVDGHSREYYFFQKYLEEEKSKLSLLMMPGGILNDKDKSRSKSTMAIRIFSSGKDLMVEWRNYVRTSRNMVGLLNSTAKAVVTSGLSLLGDNLRDPNLRGFANQDNSVLQLGVRAALEEAVDLVGISHSLIQNVSGKSGNRLI